MKTSTILKIALSIVILIVILFLINWLSEIDKDYKKTIEKAKAEISLLDEKNEILRQDTIKLNRRLDSISNVLKIANESVLIEIGKRKDLEIQNNQEIAKLKKLNNQEQVEYFISKTGNNYDILKYDGFYLIKLSSIKTANELFVGSDFNIERNRLLLSQIDKLNVVIFNEREKNKILQAKIDAQDKMLENAWYIKENLNIQIDAKDSKIFGLKLTKNLSIGISAIAIGFLLIK